MFCEIDPRVLKKLIPTFKFEATDAGPLHWIAGGAIRDSIIGDQASDLDIFGIDKAARDLFVENNLKDAKQVYTSDVVRTYIKDKTKIQIIDRDFATIAACLDSFDFTICQFAFDGKIVTCNPEALVHLFTRRLVVNRINPLFAISSLSRVQKYAKRGYTLCNGGFIELAEALRAATEDDIKNQTDFYPDGSPRVRRFD